MSSPKYHPPDNMSVEENNTFIKPNHIFNPFLFKTKACAAKDNPHEFTSEDPFADQSSPFPNTVSLQQQSSLISLQQKLFKNKTRSVDRVYFVYKILILVLLVANILAGVVIPMVVYATYNKDTQADSKYNSNDDNSNDGNVDVMEEINKINQEIPDSDVDNAFFWNLIDFDNS